MVAKDARNIQFIEEQSAVVRLLNAIFGIFLTYMGISALIGIAFESMPSPSSIEGQLIGLGILVCFAFFAVIAFYRNRIIRFIFEKLNLSKFWSLVSYSKSIHYPLLLSSITLMFLGFLYEPLLLFGFFILGFYTPLYLIFSDPLTYEGKTAIPFELFFSKANYYDQKQRWLEIICKKFSDELKQGNIKISKDELLFHFNMESLTSNNYLANLRNIEGWLLGEENLRFETICDIKDKFEVSTKYAFIKQTLGNPIAQKYFLVFAILVVFLITNAQSVIELLGII